MYKRVLLKLSGEAMAGESKSGIDNGVVDSICSKIAELVRNAEFRLALLLVEAIFGEVIMVRIWRKLLLIIWVCSLL